MKTIMMILVMLTVLPVQAEEKAFRTHTQTSTSPSPRGDTEMGADATSSGTDITDEDIQAQEDLEGNVIYMPDEKDNEPKTEEQEELIKN